MRNQELRPNLLLIINSIREFSISHHLVRIREVYNLRKIIRVEININQLFRIRSVANNMRTFRTRRKSNCITGFHCNIPIDGTNDTCTADNIEHLFIRFMIMVSIGKTTRFHFYKVHTALVHIRLRNNRFYCKFITILANFSDLLRSCNSLLQVLSLSFCF